jgi:DNA-binding NtrC family response regulator
MTDENILTGKKILIVDDEPDILDSLEDLLTMCEVTKAGNFEDAKTYMERQNFDMAVLDIMGVSGYELLEVAVRRDLPAVMLTAHALTPDNIVKSYKKGAAYFLPKEKMADIATFLADVFEARAKGENTWDSWMSRLAGYCEKTFGAKWMDPNKDFWEKFPFY